MVTDVVTAYKATNCIMQMLLFTIDGEAIAMNDYLCQLEPEVLKEMMVLSFIICGAIHTELKLSK